MELQTQDKLGCACPLFTEAEKKQPPFAGQANFYDISFKVLLFCCGFLCPDMTSEFYFGASQQISLDVQIP